MNEPSELVSLWLYDALVRRDFVTASILLQGTASLDDLIDEEGDSLLHDAADDGDLQMITFYLRFPCPRTLASFDYIAETPLIRAARNGQARAVKLLIEAGADVDARDADRIGDTATREAVRGGHVEVVRLLIDAGADPTIEGWMRISAVDQANYEVDTGIDSIEADKIRELLRTFPCSIRDH